MDDVRSEAYGRVIKTLADMGPAKLSTDEQQTIRTAADALFFEGDGYDELAAVEDLVQQLVDAGRWSAERGRQLVDDVAACGPSAGGRGARRLPRLLRHAEGRRQLAARAHVELAIGVAEVPLDRLAGDEQCLRDLPVAQPLDRQRDDAALARAERVDAAPGGALHARAGDLELLQRALLGKARAARAGKLERLAEGAARIRAPAGAAQHRAEVELRAAVLQARLGRGDERHRLLEMRDRQREVAVRLGVGERAQRDRNRARRAVGPRQ